MRYLGCKTKLLREIAALMQKKGLFDGNRTFFDALVVQAWLEIFSKVNSR